MNPRGKGGMSRLFGTDGVRGVANTELSARLAFDLGGAAVAVLTEQGETRPRVAVGRDTRASGEFLQAALVAGICSAGGDAVVLGVCTTPGVAFLTTDLGTQAGAVISASHNPAEYNGIKFFGPNGYKLPDEMEDRIESLLDREAGPRPSGRDVGRVMSKEGSMERYLAHLQSTTDVSLTGMRVVVDCANGAASTVGPKLLRRLGADVVAINHRPNGWNINDGCGATSPEAVAKAVVEAGADAGVAFDGDADRAMFADGEGRIIDGDHVLGAWAIDLHERGELPGDLVVTTVMANQGFRVAMSGSGIGLLETKVGDRYVLEEMLASGAVLGGEQSGHVIFRDHATTGDGILTALLFLSLGAGAGRSVADMAATMPRFPQVLENVEVTNREGLESAR